MRDAAKKDATASRECERLEEAGATALSAGVGGNPSLHERRNLPREWRLVRRPEFEAVYREGRRRSSANFLIFYRANGLARDRFGMSVKKALGNAVARNRIRRRVREILRLHREEIAKGWDVVIHPSRRAGTLEFKKLEAELLALLPREKQATK